jgi:hypothetical protein
MRRRAIQGEIEIAIGPHPARPDWRVLRVSYARHPEHDARIVAALDAIFGPPCEEITATDRRRTGDDPA